MIYMIKLIKILLFFSLLQSCSSFGVIRSFSYLDGYIRGFESDKITKEYFDSSKYSFANVKIGRGPAATIILAYINDGVYEWRGADGTVFFTKKDFIEGTYSYSWNNRRWNKLIKEDWIVVWRRRNRTTQKYNIYKVSFKFKQLINRIYKIMLGEEDIPTSKRRNNIIKGNSYIDKVLTKSIYNVNKDKDR